MTRTSHSGSNGTMGSACKRYAADSAEEQEHLRIIRLLYVNLFALRWPADSSTPRNHSTHHFRTRKCTRTEIKCRENPSREPPTGLIAENELARSRSTRPTTHVTPEPIIAIADHNVLTLSKLAPIYCRGASA